jgi:flagellar protein FliS
MNAPNPYAKQAETYKKNQIETATPEEILIMLYEGAIRFLLVAQKSDQEKNLEKFSKNIIKTQHIIREFMESLDLEIGGEMAQNLYRLYDYLHYRLVQANIKKDVAMLDEVLDHLRKLKATWEEAILIAKREKETSRDESETSLHA